MIPDQHPPTTLYTSTMVEINLTRRRIAAPDGTPLDGIRPAVEVSFAKLLPILAGDQSQAYDYRPRAAENLRAVMDTVTVRNMVAGIKAGLDCVKEHAEEMQGQTQLGSGSPGRHDVPSWFPGANLIYHRRKLCLGTRNDFAYSIAYQMVKDPAQNCWYEDARVVLFTISLTMPLSKIQEDCLDRTSGMRSLLDVAADSAVPWQVRVDSTPLWRRVFEESGDSHGVFVHELQKVSRVMMMMLKMMQRLSDICIPLILFPSFAFKQSLRKANATLCTMQNEFLNKDVAAEPRVTLVEQLPYPSCITHGDYDPRHVRRIRWNNIVKCFERQSGDPRVLHAVMEWIYRGYRADHREADVAVLAAIEALSAKRPLLFRRFQVTDGVAQRCDEEEEAARERPEAEERDQQNKE